MTHVSQKQIPLSTEGSTKVRVLAGIVLGILVIFIAIWAWLADEKYTTREVSELSPAMRALEGDQTVRVGNPDDVAGLEKGAAGSKDHPPLLEEDANLVDDPSPYYGKPLMIRGEVEKVIGPHGFRIDIDGVLGTDSVLVFLVKPVEVTLENGELVTVNGTLWQFDIEDISKDREVPIQREEYQKFDEEPALFARIIYPHETADLRSE